MKNLVLPVLLVLALPATGRAGDITPVSAEILDRPETAGALLALAPLRAAVARLARADDRVLEIFYPGGEEGALRAARLEGWLVALGVPSTRMVVLPGGVEAGYIGLRVGKSKTRKQRP